MHLGPRRLRLAAKLFQQLGQLGDARPPVRLQVVAAGLEVVALEGAVATLAQGDGRLAKRTLQVVVGERVANALAEVPAALARSG